MTVSTIVTVGIVANNLILRRPKKVYQERISLLNSLVTRLDSHIETLRKYRDELSNFWEGEDAEKYKALLQSQLNSLDSSRQIVVDDIAMYKQFIDELSETQNITSDIMDDAMGILGSLESKLSSMIDGANAGGGSMGGR